MLAFASTWIGLAAFMIALLMGLYRPAFTDLGITLVLWFASPGALCLGGLVLWAHRNEESTEAGIRAQRTQSVVGIALAIVAAAIVYGLIFYSTKLEPIEAKGPVPYNPAVPTVTALYCDDHARYA